METLFIFWFSRCTKKNKYWQLPPSCPPCAFSFLYQCNIKFVFVFSTNTPLISQLDLFFFNEPCALLNDGVHHMKKLKFKAHMEIYLFGNRKKSADNEYKIFFFLSSFFSISRLPFLVFVFLYILLSFFSSCYPVG